MNSTPQPTVAPAASGAAGKPAGSPGFVQGLIAGALLSAVVCAAALLWMRWPQPAPIVLQLPPTPPPIVAPTPAPVTVYVSGAVVAPGLYTLAGEGRVADALAAAGGLRAEADDALLNLAQRLPDGARLHVPAVGETAPVALVDQPEAVTRAGTSLGVAGAPLNLNQATLEELLALPGVGEKTAAAIVAARPFASFDALDAVPGIGPATLETLRPLVTAP